MMRKEQVIKDTIPNIEIKAYNIMIDGKKFFDQPKINIIKQHMTILEKLLLVKEMIMLLVVC